MRLQQSKASNNNNKKNSSSGSNGISTAITTNTKSIMTRKDDPVFNVKFVHLVESHPCLWNSKLPAYSKKDETQHAWQEVANATNESVQNCRERWRTIRSSFLRSLKMSRTNTGRGKRKYYLSKYLQFLIPYTKTRPKNGNKSSSPSSSNANAVAMPPMTHISNMPVPANSSDDTKEYGSTEVEIAEEDVVVALNEGSGSNDANPSFSRALNADNVNGITTAGNGSGNGGGAAAIGCGSGDGVSASVNVNLNARTPLKVPMPIVFPLPLQRLTAIKTEADINGMPTNYQPHSLDGNSAAGGEFNGTGPQQQTPSQQQQQQQQQQSHLHGPNPNPASTSGVDLTEFAEWIKSKNVHQRHCLIPPTLSPDADQSFLNSLHPYMKEMSGKQNRRFRQKVVALIDAILDNADD